MLLSGMMENKADSGCFALCYNKLPLPNLWLSHWDHSKKSQRGDCQELLCVITMSYNLICLLQSLNYIFVFPESLHICQRRQQWQSLESTMYFLSALTSVHPLKGCRCILGGSTVVEGWEEWTHQSPGFDGGWCHGASYSLHSGRALCVA